MLNNLKEMLNSKFDYCHNHINLVYLLIVQVNN